MLARITNKCILSQSVSTMTLVPRIYQDYLFGKETEFIKTVYCLEDQKEYNVPPYLAKSDLAGYLQSLYPLSQVEVIQSEGIN